MPNPDLISRVEAATCGERELDAAIFCHFNPGWEPSDRMPGAGTVQKVGQPGWLSTATDVTTSLDAALALVERCLPGCVWQVGSTPSFFDRRPFWAQLRPDETDIDGNIEGFAPTPALALCLALLRALEPQTNA